MADSCRVRAVASEEVSRGQVVGGRLWGNGGGGEMKLFWTAAAIM